MTFTVTRSIGIDAGHRIMTHGSQCRHIHGHRYTIEAACTADTLQDSGEQTDMAVEFGFLKEEMLRLIDAPCDHGFIAALADLDLLAMFAPDGAAFAPWLEEIAAEVRASGHCATTRCRLDTRLYVVPFQPTAECLARHWFGRLKAPVAERSLGCAALTRVTVWETPNCRATYEEESRT